jgi:hypothetical protein
MKGPEFRPQLPPHKKIKTKKPNTENPVREATKALTDGHFHRKVQREGRGTGPDHLSTSKLRLLDLCPGPRPLQHVGRWTDCGGGHVS